MTQIDNRQQLTDPLSFPQTGILRSSESFGWRGIIVEQRYHPAGEYVFPSTSSHMIGLHQGPPISVEQVHNGRSTTCMMVCGSVQIVPAGTESIWRHQDGADHMHILLTSELLQQGVTDHNQPPLELLDLFNTQDPRIEHISSALLTEVLEEGATGRLYVEGLAHALAAHLIHAYTQPSRPHSKIIKRLPTSLFQRITSLIEDRLTEDLSLAELAFEVNLSPSHFLSLFRKTTGLSPHQYIVRRRVEHAQHLLRATRLSIGEIAATVGFYDQSHLVRQMRRVMGVTPTYIREHLS